MIRWHGLHNEYFHFQIVGYEFPQATEDYDANWLIITTEAANEQGTWTRRCACLLTWEVAWLIHWLEQVVIGEAEPIFSVLEVDLILHSIGLSQGKHRVAICLAFGLGYEVPPAEPGNTSIIVVDLTDTDLQDAIVALKQWLVTFPLRGKQGQVMLASCL